MKNNIFFKNEIISNKIAIIQCIIKYFLSNIYFFARQLSHVPTIILHSSVKRRIFSKNRISWFSLACMESFYQLFTFNAFLHSLPCSTRRGMPATSYFTEIPDAERVCRIWAPKTWQFRILCYFFLLCHNTPSEIFKIFYMYFYKKKGNFFY